MTTSSSPSVSPSAPPVPQLFVGIDVAKDALDLARSDTGELLHVPNDAAGIRRIVAALAKTPPTCIVLESTGGLEMPLLEALLDAHLAVARVNPGRVRHLAIALGILAKTDAIDAATLMKFAQVAAPRLALKRSEKQAELDALVTCRRQLVAAKTSQGNQMATTASPFAKKALRAVLASLDKQIKRLDKQIASIIDSDDDMKHKDRILQSAPGVGPVLSSAIISQLPEAGQIDRHEVAALTGVAPFNHDSGKHKGKRAIRGGRADLRCILYMGTQIAMMHNPVLRTMAQRLEKLNKLPKVIIVACMRKFITLLNAMLRDNLTWDQLDVAKKLALNA
jgi:transposase